MAKMGRPVKYTNEDERPETISVRVPKEFYDRVKAYAHMHRMSFTELVKDGLEWRITEGDPRAPIVLKENTYDKSVIQELARAVIDELGQEALAKALAPVQPIAPPVSTNGHTVSQPAADLPPFDPLKFRWGKPCMKNPAHVTNGQTMRYVSGTDCVACQREKARKQHATPPATREA